MNIKEKSIGQEKGWFRSSDIQINDLPKYVDEIISEIIRDIPRDLSGQGLGDNTITIKSFFADLGIEKGYKCWTNHLNEYEQKLEKGSDKCKSFRNHEWLFDLIWYNEKGSDSPYTITELCLALECEWNHYRKKDAKNKCGDCKACGGKVCVGYEGEKFDFQKLVVSNAILSVLVFRRQKKGIDDFDAYVNNQISAYEACRGRFFLCIAYDFDMKDFSYKVFGKESSR